MGATIISITFETTAHRHRDGQFTVPKKVCQCLGVDGGDEIIIDINGHRYQKRLSSGTEIYGPDIAAAVKAGAVIQVTVHRPEAKKD